MSMADLGWLLDVGKFVGGAAAGWLGNIWKGRSKKKNMRKHLYKEIAENFMRVDNALYNPHAAHDAIYKLPANMSFAYYDHAMKDMDTFHDIDDYLEIRSFYKMCRNISEATEWDPVRRDSLAFYELVGGMVALQTAPGLALLSSAPQFAKKRLVNGALAIAHPTEVMRLRESKHLRRYVEE